MGALAQAGRNYAAEQVVPLLDDRLTVTLPAGARAEARGQSLMGVAASGQTETRVLYDVGGERLVLLASELFRVVPGELRAAIDGVTGGWDLPPGQHLVPLDTGPDTVGYGYFPLDSARQAVPIADAFVRTAESGIVRIQLFVSPNAADDRDGLTELAAQILRTVRPGERPLDAHAGSRVLAGLDGETILTADVRAGWVAYQESGLSFVVLRLLRLTPLGGPFASVTLYRGSAPNLVHQRFPADAVTRSGGRLLGLPTDWVHVHTGIGGASAVHMREALVEDGHGQFVHALAETDEPAFERELDELLGSIRRT
ncbi:hypothetical protein Dvina_12370 [Dactylosporangium vinaceum]|uniref:Uncharacterized protein n=1 Tax=Dactylosporangium vinaceum TaxID=53362 RepID=A0ABV5MFQ2_9ACTN|nr:hypothetical protein [Dactylosporangium vinaceum]UAB98792.1 hypothetical protein Dvina_12370 [Dactylosporangium vinaceum]